MWLRGADAPEMGVVPDLCDAPDPEQAASPKDAATKAPMTKALRIVGRVLSAPLLVSLMMFLPSVVIRIEAGRECGFAMTTLTIERNIGRY